MRHRPQAIGPGMQRLKLRLLAVGGVGCILALLVVWVWVTRKAATVIQNTPHPTTVEDRLQQKVEAQLPQSADQAMQADCWRYGGHGSDSAIAAFNAQLPAALAALLSEPEAQALSAQQLEMVFTTATGLPVTLFIGDSDVLLAAIAPLYCAAGLHDGSGVTVYAVDQNGHSWEIGHPRSLLSAQWIEERWIATADVALTVYNPPNVPELWVISLQDGVWTVTDKFLHAAGAETITVSFEESSRTLVADVITRQYFQYGDAPCEAIQRRPDYWFTEYAQPYLYQWREDHYEQAGTRPLKAISVVFVKESTTVPDFSGVEVTPGSNFYEIDNWQPLCP